MGKQIVMIGAFDTKGPEYGFLREQILVAGHTVLSINTGVFPTTELFPIDVGAEQLASAGGKDLAQLRHEGDRGAAMKVMCRGAASVVRQIYDQGRCDGIIGMGGTGGTSVVTAAMRELPIGVPKVCVSTAAATDTAPYVGIKDVILIPSIVDVAGVNRISRTIFARAAGAICGMVEREVPAAVADRPVVAASMFGNTTPCVDACRALLGAHGYEVIVFHATGAGGRTMESLVAEGWVDAVLDTTTTEWADTVCGGCFSAGEDRLSAPGRYGVPHLIVPGCVDMANFGPIDSVPLNYREAGRTLYPWNPSVTLMRTNVEENRRMGEIFAAKANAAQGPVAFLLPLRGVSMLDGDGQPFCDRQADRAMFDALREHLDRAIECVEIDCNINDAEFADRAVRMLLDLVAAGKQSRSVGMGRHPK